jgi:hypothetical protein
MKTFGIVSTAALLACVAQRKLAQLKGHDCGGRCTVCRLSNALGIVGAVGFLSSSLAGLARNSIA